MDRSQLLERVQEWRSLGAPVDRCASGRFFGSSFARLGGDEECPGSVSVFLVYLGRSSEPQVWGLCPRHVSVGLGMAEMFGDVLGLLPAQP